MSTHIRRRWLPGAGIARSVAGFFSRGANSSRRGAAVSSWHPMEVMKQFLFATVLLFALGWANQGYAHGDEAVPVAKQQTGSTAPAVAGVGGAAAVADHAEHEDEANVMLHPGVPEPWIIGTSIAVFAIALWALFARLPSEAPPRSFNLATLPLIGRFVRFLNGSPYPLLAVRMISVAGFLLVIYAGLFGTSYPERNLATTFVWNLWWPLVVVSVLFLGTACVPFVRGIRCPAGSCGCACGGGPLRIRDCAAKYRRICKTSGWR